MFVRVRKALDGVTVLNLTVGSQGEVGGVTCIMTKAGVGGHAVFGPYAALGPGDYAVEFILAAQDDAAADPNDVCAILDVTRDLGQETLARADIRCGELTAKRTFPLAFRLEKPSRVEYRVYVTGAQAMVVEEHRRLARAPAAGMDPVALLADGGFPAADTSVPQFFRDNWPMFRKLYEDGARVALAEDGVVLTIKDVSFHARCADDLLFVGEIFFESTYNLISARDCCLIDIGMNIGLVSLYLSSRDVVKEVHAFEPFKDTYDRAAANLGLNPTLAAKISAHNFGISDRDENTIINVFDFPDSGGRATRNVEGGKPVHIVTRDAAAALGPIIAAANAQQRDVIMKVDCEGAEFAIFSSLEAAGLLEQITAVMVEWHSVFEGKTQDELIGALTRAGFIAFDLTSKPVNGFFYAVRAAVPVSSAGSIDNAPDA